MKTAVILPTGDEIRSGIVLDTDSPEVMAQLIRMEPELAVSRWSPVEDEEEIICRAVKAAAETADLVVLIGGSGGGHRYSETLSRDFTHTALDALLQPCVSRRLFGKNGHLWCRLVCGRLGDTLVINLPGPFVEAQAAMAAFCKMADTNDLDAINLAMTEAVKAQYPTGAEVR